jgi:ATP-dependent Clp endopeptidase proteolytic subunit ClpP
MAVDLQPTELMAEEAERGLAWREEYNRGGTEVGVARARDIKNRKNLSPDTVRRMKSYFARHEVDKEAEGFRPGEDGYPSAGRIAWALWGGDAGQSWANRKSEELDNEAEGMASKSNWYAIHKASDGETEVEVSIYDEIGFGGVTAKDFMAEVKKLKGQHIHLRINSVGGSVIEGAAIYNALRRHKGGLTVHVDGLAASMASVIAMAGEEVFIADNAMLMIHNPWSMTMGDADDLRKEADVLDKLKNTLVNAYARKTGMETNDIAAMMDEETWLNATQSVAMGFADEIEDGIEAAASITPATARQRFDTFSHSMARKSKTILAEEVAAEVVAPVEAPVIDEVAVDNSSEAMNAELQAKVDALQADLDANNAAQAQASEDIAKEIEALKAEVDRLTAESAGKDDEIAALTAAAKSAGEQAAAIVASVGIDAATVVPSEPELSPAQIFNSLNGAEAVEFYRNNKREILASVY